MAIFVVWALNTQSADGLTTSGPRPGYEGKEVAIAEAMIVAVVSVRRASAESRKQKAVVGGRRARRLEQLKV